MKIKAFMLFYRVLWLCLLPLILVYLFLRGRKDPLYREGIPERFGVYRFPLPQKPIWVHAVSIGELRSALTLIQLALDRGDKVLVSVFTPAGRRDAEKQFSAAIAAGDLAVVWVPFDMGWCHRRLIKACHPRICLPLEVEIWPSMIHEMRKAGVPLYLCNAQYASKSIERDDKGLRIRPNIIAKCAGAFVKSDVQKERFSTFGVTDIVVTGELRFDQGIPLSLTDAAERLRRELKLHERQVIAIASGVEGEEDLYASMILELRALAADKGVAAPLIVYVPRAPERFGQVGDDLERVGIKVCRRSTAFEEGSSGLNRTPSQWTKDVEVLLGDSLGEMYFYLALADKVIVGGGFTERGAHNIIEPLAVGKPVFVGPFTWTIEFPFLEAEAVGIARSFETMEGMVPSLLAAPDCSSDEIAKFIDQHRGASQRTLEGIDSVLSNSIR